MRSVDAFLRREPLLPLAEFPSAAETFPLRRLRFHNFSVNAPRDPAPMLTRLYGPDWASTAVVWSHSSKRLMRMALEVYERAVAAAGYVAQSAQPTSAESLAQAGLESEGDIIQLCWDRLGWASPFHVEIGGASGEFEVDEVSMGLLQLSCRRFPLSPGASRALADGGLEALRRDTGAFLAVELSEGEGAAQPTLRAVGSEEDLERIETQLRRFE